MNNTSSYVSVYFRVACPTDFQPGVREDILGARKIKKINIKQAQSSH
jgi:hypothetical protein